MASTITPTTLKVTIREQINMGGTDFGAKTEFSLNNISEVSRRRMTTNGTGSTIVIRFMPSASAGQFINTDIRYVRITNLDNSNYATMRYVGSGSTDYSFRLDPTGSHIMALTQPSSSAVAGVTSYADIAGLTLTDLRTITAVANSASVDLELFVASI